MSLEPQQTTFDLDNKSGLVPFGIELSAFTRELGIAGVLTGLQADHIGLRFKDKNTVLEVHKYLMQRGKLFPPAIVNGREICIFKLNEPIQFGIWKIPCIELPFPAERHTFPNDGPEHIEFVLPSNKPVETEAELIQHFREKFPQLNLSHLQEKGIFRTSVPEVQGVEQLPNPTIILEAKRGLAIKFHAHSIEEIVTSGIKED